MSSARLDRILDAISSANPCSRFFCFALAWVVGAAAASVSPVLELDRASRASMAGEHLSFVEDRDLTLSIEDVVRLGPHKWRSKNTAPSFGITRSQYWFYVRVKNVDNLPLDFIALVDYTALDEVDFFLLQPSSGAWKENYQSGDRRSFDSRPVEHLSFAFPFQLPAGAEALLFLRVKSDGNIAVPLLFSEKSLFFRDQKNHFFLYGLIIGIMMITGIYNLFVYARTREIVFFAFSLFVFSVATLFTNQSGLAYLYFWPGAVEWNEVCVLATISFMTFSHCYFAIHFLSVGGIQRKLFIYPAGLALLHPLFFLFFPYTLLLSSVLLIGVLALTHSALIVFFLWQKDYHARVYAIAWSPFFCGALLAALIRFAIVPYNFIFENAAFFGSLATIIVFSMAIADRINGEKQSRIDAQRLAIESLEKYETLFKESIEGIYMFTVEGRLLSANPAFLNMFGYTDVLEYSTLVMEDVSKLYVEKAQYHKIVRDLERDKTVVGREAEMRHKDGSTFWASTSVRMASKTDKGYEYVEGTIIDISERKESERKLAYLATHDPLTNIFNRRQFENILQTAVSKSKLGKSHYTLLYMDLDQFKIVNDTCGHSAGDQLLKQLTKLLVKSLGTKGVIARLGGDEFGVLVSKSREGGAYAIAERFCELVQFYRFVWEKRIFNLGVSIGLVELTQNLTTVEDIMRLADTACYAAKDAGRNRIHTYTADNVALRLRRREMELVSAVNTSMAEDNFHLVRQRIADCQDPRITVGYEILVRVRDSDGHYVEPTSFIPAAERYNIMSMIDRWVTKNVFAWLHTNPSEMEKVDRYAINLSSKSLNDDKFKNYLVSLFADYQVLHEKICFEVTETTAIQNIHETQIFIQSLQKLGCKFALDDFGTGFSSYGYLKSLPVDHLKIDGEFIRNIEHDDVDVAMVKSICSVAQAMGKKTTAEFVENASIAAHLKEVGVDYLQGYYVGKPEPIVMENIIEKNVSAIEH